MGDILIFTAQGKYKNYPGKSTIIDELKMGKEVELTFVSEEKQIIIINQYGEISGCIPSENPKKMKEYIALQQHLNAESFTKAIAVPRGTYTYDVLIAFNQ